LKFEKHEKKTGCVNAFSTRPSYLITLNKTLFQKDNKKCFSMCVEDVNSINHLAQGANVSAHKV
jgi:hypothetical protein